MRKPEPEIFAHTVALLGLTAAECVFVDDLRHNVDAAVALGFVGVHHRTYAATATELDVLFGLMLPRVSSAALCRCSPLRRRRAGVGRRR